MGVKTEVKRIKSMLAFIAIGTSSARDFINLNLIKLLKSQILGRKKGNESLI